MTQDTKHWFKNPNTSWNLRRKDSEYHFDPTLNDNNYPGLRSNFVQFKGDWQSEIDNSKFEESPPFDTSNYLTRIAVQDQIELGIDHRCEGKRMTVNPTDHPKIQKIVSSLGLAKSYAQILILKTGEYFQYHIDQIACQVAYAPKRHESPDLKEVLADESSIRLFIALEDWQWGHYMIMGNYHWVQWKAGDTLWFRWQDMPHGSFNCGHKNRPMLKVTGEITDKFKSLLEKKNHVININ